MAVVNDGGIEIIGQQHRRIQGPAATETPAQGSNRRGTAHGLQEIKCAADIFPRRLRVFHDLLHQDLRFSGCRGNVATIEVFRQQVYDRWEEEGRDLTDIAVLYRSHGNALELEPELNRRYSFPCLQRKGSVSNPASRSAIACTLSLRPHHSWMTIRPGNGSTMSSGKAKCP